MGFVPSSTSSMAGAAPRAYQAPAAGDSDGGGGGNIAAGGEGLSSRLSALREMRQRVRSNTASTMSKHFVAATSDAGTPGSDQPSGAGAPPPPPPPPVPSATYAVASQRDAGSGAGNGSGGSGIVDPIAAAIAAARARAAAAGIQSAPPSGVKRSRWEEGGASAGNGNYKAARYGWGASPSQPSGYVKGQRY